MIDNIAEQLEAEKARINEARLLAWSSVAGYETICGIRVNPLTARAWIDLRLAQNEIICGTGDHTDGAIAAYVWRVSKDYVCSDNPSAEKLKMAMIKKIKDFDAAFIEVIEHIRAAFEELPQTSSTGGGAFSRKNGVEDVEGIVGAIDEVSNRYGQNPCEAMDWPLNRIFQLQKAIRLATVPGYKLRQPDLIMELRSKFLEQINNG